MIGLEHCASSETIAWRREKVNGDNGSISASSSASSRASSIHLNLGVGCAPSCWPIFGFRNLLGARRGAEGSFLCSLSSRFSGRGGGGGACPGRGGELGCQAQQVLTKKKCVRLASAFPSPPFRSSDFAGLRRPRLYGFHTHSRTSGAFRIARDAGSSGRREISLESKLNCVLIDYPS